MSSNRFNTLGTCNIIQVSRWSLPINGNQIHIKFCLVEKRYKNKQIVYLLATSLILITFSDVVDYLPSLKTLFILPKYSCHPWIMMRVGRLLLKFDDVIDVRSLDARICGLFLFSNVYSSNCTSSTGSNNGCGLDANASVTFTGVGNPKRFGTRVQPSFKSFKLDNSALVNTKLK